MKPLDNIPPLGERPGVNEAMKMVAIAVESMEADGQLAERWDELKGMILGWANRTGGTISPETLLGLRLQLEGICGDSEEGEMLIAAAKLGMSAVLTAVPNAYYIILEDRDEIHDDIAPLVTKGLHLLYSVANVCEENRDPVVRIDYELQDRWEAKRQFHLEQAEESSKKTWVQELIDSAVRPGAQN